MTSDDGGENEKEKSCVNRFSEHRPILHVLNRQLKNIYHPAQYLCFTIVLNTIKVLCWMVDIRKLSIAS